MAIGRLVHVAADLVLVSVALAGIRRSTGMTPALTNPDSAVQSVARKYLEAGERILDAVQTQMAGSAYVKRD
ncbi:hypothetical protein LPJ61_002057 [Coemansia biformis]|uniref:DUF1748-domain-containing protein n=1 Tax=Coemansia biformis TaxID=1286918 RepID=A0A9W7YFK0_9FUNG|nr:hypothetical protein LPJ61_002057 [Coemansia biformis]